CIDRGRGLRKILSQGPRRLADRLSLWPVSAGGRLGIAHGWTTISRTDEAAIWWSKPNVGSIRRHCLVGHRLSHVPGMATAAARKKAPGRYAAALLVEAPLGCRAGGWTTDVAHRLSATKHLAKTSK